MPRFVAVKNLATADYYSAWVLHPPLVAGGYGVVDTLSETAARGISAGQLAPVPSNAGEPAAVQALQRATKANAGQAALVPPAGPTLLERLVKLEQQNTLGV